MEITVKDWIPFKDADKYTDNGAGSMGGWVNGENFDEFKAELPEELHPYYDAIRKSVVEQHLRLTGEHHQYGDAGVPLFSDDTVSTFSYRGWGDIMAAIWNSEEPEKKYSYMHFYM